MNIIYDHGITELTKIHKVVEVAVKPEEVQSERRVELNDVFDDKVES